MEQRTVCSIMEKQNEITEVLIQYIITSWSLIIKYFLKKEPWVRPVFLLWPSNPDEMEDISPGLRCQAHNTTQVSEEVVTVICFILYFSSWTHLKRVVAWLRLKTLFLHCSRKRKPLEILLRFIQLKNIGKISHKWTQESLSFNINHILTVDELANAGMAVISFWLNVQSEKRNECQEE